MRASQHASRSAAIVLAAGAMSCTPVPMERSGGQPAALAGRTAGPARRCVPIQRNEALRLGADRVVLYGGGRTLWVNRLPEGCTGMRRNDILVVEPVGGSYCRGDRICSVDPLGRLPGPSCRLSDFVPFTESG